MADIVCTVPDCDAQAVLVLNGHPICRPHCEEFASRAEILQAASRDVAKAPAGEVHTIGGGLPGGGGPADNEPNAST